MFRIVIAPDKFKGSLDSFALCRIIEKGLRSASTAFDIIPLPLADGGDGLLDIIAHYTGGGMREMRVKGPLFKPVMAQWLLSADGRTAYVEMARASGLHLLEPSEYDCIHSSTYGTGELIAEAIRCGVSEVVIGIGGSATNDGGMGMAAALGYRFLDKAGKELSPIGGNLGLVEKIEVPPRWGDIKFRVACDVSNPLYGSTGATRVYAAQKGADPRMIEQLEAGMQHYAIILKRELGLDIADREGAGAAGGLGAGCLAFLHAEMVSGARLAIEYSKAEQQIREADLVITGEGRMDRQTPEGKLIAGIAALGRQYQKPVLAICGTLDLPPAEWREMGVTAAFSIINKPMTLETAQAEAEPLLEEAAHCIGALLVARP
jgi:glycerate kinase